MTEPIRTPFEFASTADQVLDGVDLHGKRVIVTGASSGLGVETARALAKAGAEVTLADQFPARLESIGQAGSYIPPMNLSSRPRPALPVPLT